MVLFLSICGTNEIRKKILTVAKKSTKKGIKNTHQCNLSRRLTGSRSEWHFYQFYQLSCVLYSTISLVTTGWWWAENFNNQYSYSCKLVTIFRCSTLWRNIEWQLQSWISCVIATPTDIFSLSYLFERELRWIISPLLSPPQEHPCLPFMLVSSRAKANICWVPVRVEERNWSVTFFFFGATAPGFNRLTLTAEDWLLQRSSLKVAFHIGHGTQDYFSKWCVDAFRFGRGKLDTDQTNFCPFLPPSSVKPLAELFTFRSALQSWLCLVNASLQINFDAFHFSSITDLFIFLL